MDSLTNDELKNRHICAAHFPLSNFHQASTRSRLLGPAVPIPFDIDDTMPVEQHMEIGETFTHFFFIHY